VLVPRDLVVQAPAAVVANAIEARRPVGRDGMVDVAVRANGRDGDSVTVRDNGAGIAGADPGTSFGSIAPTKGRPAAGLQTSEMAIVASRGRIGILETGPKGTTISRSCCQRGPRDSSVRSALRRRPCRVGTHAAYRASGS
jgi:hypothetical protein